MDRLATPQSDAIDLVSHAAFRLGDLLVDPPLRRLAGPLGETAIEPRVMQVLLALVETEGQVQTREALVRRCWAGLFVGEDSLTRAIGEIRRALRQAGSSNVRLETISKAGYRLVVEGETRPAPPVPPPARADEPGKPARRALLGAGALALAGIGAWRFLRPDPAAARVEALIGQGRDCWRLAMPQSDAQGVGFLKEAVTLNPRSEEAWGLLALLWRNIVEIGEPAEATEAFANCQSAARQALAIDVKQGDALAALAGLLPIYGDWLGAERRLDSVLKSAPNSVPALSELGLLQMSTGRIGDSFVTAERLAERDPLAATHQYKLIYRLWAVGREAEMDRVADRAMNLWPAHPAVWFARLWTYAYTGRSEAALRMLNDERGRLPLPPPMLELFRRTFAAIGSRRPEEVAQAVELNLAAGRQAPGAAVMAVQHLAFLGALDQAFDVARGYLLRRGPEVGHLRQDEARVVLLNDQHRRKTMMLFIPATASMRADPRFLTLAREMGMADYWAATGKPPDFLRA